MELEPSSTTLVCLHPSVQERLVYPAMVSVGKLGGGGLLCQTGNISMIEA